MLIGVSEGDRFRFEIMLMSDGYIVRARCTNSNVILSGRDRLFRTAPAAFAFAEKSALKDAEDRTAQTGIEALEARMQSDRAAKVFDEIRAQLGDGGVGASLLHAWDARAQASQNRAVN